MSVRRLWVLVSRLPPESHTQAGMSGRPGEGPERAEWTTANHLLAAVHDQLQSLNYLTGAVNAGRKNPVPQPTPIPRPGLPDPTPDKPPRPRRRPPPKRI